MSAIAQALQLDAAGRGAEAVPLLEASHEPDAPLALALWLIEGRVVPRDMAAARRRLKAAVDRGHAGAARILSGMIAAGYGGSADWPRAMALVDRFAPRDPQAARQKALIAAMALRRDGTPRSLPPAEPLHDMPAMWRIPGLFTPEECRYLVEVAAQRFKPGMIFHEGEQRFVRHPTRDSHTAGFPVITQWPAIHALNLRLAAATGTDVEQGEPLQLLRYEPGQQYRHHLDALRGLANQRILTALVWLNDGYEGGETDFLDLGIRFRGAIGEALVFANTQDGVQPDPIMRHAGLPVTRGTKLLASRWIRARPPAPGESFGPEEVRSA